MPASRFARNVLPNNVLPRNTGLGVTLRRYSREVRYFLFSQYFSDGLRTTLAILLPALLLAQFDQLELGFMVSLGALCVSITDMPGPWLHKRNGMLYCCGFIFLTALLTGFARRHDVALGLEIVLLSFGYAMFMVYGPRAAAVGSAGLLVMILMMDRPLTNAGVWQQSALILGGGLWYTATSLLASRLRPYRLAQQALGECVHELARFLYIKADFYDTATDLTANYRKLVAQQVVASEKQDAVRELLFKGVPIAEDASGMGQLLVLTFTDVVDLYENSSAMYYDYAALRERFGQTGVLGDVARLIRRLATHLDSVGLAIEANRPDHPPLDLTEPLDALKARIDALPTDEGSTLVLRRILVNFRTLYGQVQALLRYYSPAGNDGQPATLSAYSSHARQLDYTQFVTHQVIDWQRLRDNLTLTSPVFRHAVRMAVACLIGLLTARLLPYGQHTYWILLTVTVILKPAYSLTKQRNVERIIGTLAGGLLGVLVLVLVGDKTARFGFLLLFMLLTYSFQRKNYSVMVVSVTPLLLILFSFMGLGFLDIVGERILDTLIGCLIAFATSLFVFPNWESEQLTTFVRDVLKADVAYLHKLAQLLAGQPVAINDYKVARKELYVQSANLSAAYQRMLSEPKRKQRQPDDVHGLVVMNHILASNIATVATTLLSREPRVHPDEVLRPVRRALALLRDTSARFGTERADPPTPDPPPNVPTAPDDPLLREQVDFIQKISADVARLADAIRH